MERTPVITCPDCGEPLLDELDLDHVVVEGERYRLRRGSDHVACEECGAVHRVRALRAAAVARGELAAEEAGGGTEGIVEEIVDALTSDEAEAADPPANEG